MEPLRQRLARTACPPPSPPVPGTTPTATINRALRRHAPALLADMLERSVLSTAGSCAAVEHLHRRALDGGILPPLVYDLPALNIGIRSMCTAATAGRKGSCASSTPNL